MNRDEELAVLRRKKKEIENRIRELKAEAIVVGNAKYDFLKNIPNDAPYDKVPCVYVRYHSPCNKYDKWSPVFAGINKHDITEILPAIIKDLEALCAILAKEDTHVHES